MVAQITPLSTPVPNSYDMTQNEFESATNTFIGELPAFGTEANALAAEVNTLALNAEAAAGELANAKWVSGNYTEGDVTWSPTDYFNYRCKTTGSRTTDPAADPTNWALLTKTGNGGSDTTSSAVDITLTSLSGRLQVISMTASNKKVTLPAATTLTNGAPVFVIKNSGTYRFAVRKNGGGFLCYVNPGQVVAFGCSNISTGAGVWTINGDGVETIYDGNTAEVLNAVDSRYIAVAMLSATKAFCAYRNNSTGYLWGIVLNYGSASGTPAAITAEAVRFVSVAAQTSTQCTVVYQLDTATTVKGYVIDISVNAFTPGAVATIHTNASNGQSGTSITALSSTQLLCAYMSAGVTTIQERILDISGSTITASAAATADSTSVSSLFVSVKKISASKAITCGSTTTQIFLRLQSVTGSTPSATGSVLTITHNSVNGISEFDVIALSSTRAAVLRFIDKMLTVYILDISSITPVLVNAKMITVTGGPAVTQRAYAKKLDANTIYATWTGGFSSGVDGAIVRVTDDDKVIVHDVSDNIEPGVTNTSQYLACDALDSTHVMQVCRNASTFLSAKVLELNY